MLDRFLAGRAVEGEEHATWRHPDGSPMPLRLRYYLTADEPPEAYVTSVRAVVLKGSDVLVLRNPDAVHALPGGRREQGETLLDTLRREILEESGYEVEGVTPLGVVHLRHLAPVPPEYRFLHPDFLWAIHRAAVSAAEPRSVDDDYEVEAAFVPVAEALGRVDFGSRIFVEAATLER